MLLNKIQKIKMEFLRLRVLLKFLALLTLITLVKCQSGDNIDATGGVDIEGSGDSEIIDVESIDSTDSDNVVVENVPYSPPVGTILKFDMNPKPSGQGMSTKIYFTVMDNAIRMHCDVSAQAGTPAARNWPQEFQDDDNSSVGSDDSTSIDGDASVISSGRQVVTKKNKNRAKITCSQTMPHLYVLKDITCCGDPSLPQCSSIEGKKLGCIEATGE